MRILIIVLILIVSYSCNRGKHENHTDDSVYYTCSMDPQVVESKPGKCPICKMPLTAIKKSTLEDKDEIQLSDQQIQLGNIKVDTIKPGLLADNLVLTGIVNIDQNKTTSISTRLMGRMDRLYFKNVGDYVKKGDKVFDFYSEELNNAKQEYHLLLQKRKNLGNSIVDFEQLIRSAKMKLQLWGLTEAQIKQIENSETNSLLTTYYSPSSGYITSLDALEGQYLMEGATVLKLADLSSVWAEAQVYLSQLGQVDPNSMAKVEFPDIPGSSIAGKVEFVNPEINPETRITLLRVSIPNRNNQLKPGMAAYILLQGKQHSSLTLPTDAVIQDGKGATVWIRTGTNSFKNKMVRVGLENNGVIEVLEGLQAGDIVVISGAYLLNSEYVFKKGTNPMSGHDMKNM